MAGIVVGVDGSRQADDSLRWAVDEAFVRDTTVTTLMAWSRHDCPTAVVDPATAQGAYCLQAVAHRILQAAVRRTQDRRRPVGVVEQVIHGDSADVLLAASERADLLVVGVSGGADYQRSHLGAVTATCMSRATVPLVVVPSRPRGLGGAVVAGVDGSAASLGALRWAAEAARARSAVLRVVHAWSLLPAGHSDGGQPAWIGAREAENAARDLLADSVKLGIDGVDDLVVEPVLVPGDPAPSLLSAARDAQLLVVGASTVNPSRRFTDSSTGRQCVLGVPCPVVLVRS